MIAGWKGLLAGMPGVTQNYLNHAVKSLGEGGALLLVYDDRLEYGYVEENRAGCLDALRAAIEGRTGREVEIQVKYNDSGRPNDEAYLDLSKTVLFEIEEEDF